MSTTPKHPSQTPIMYNISESDLISNQNNRIMELTSELAQKNSIISSLQSKANLTETTLNQLETYKKEISLLNSKLSLSKYEPPASDLPSQISSLKLNQTLLENTILSKDKKISQLLSIIKQYETQIHSLSLQNTSLSQTNSQLQQKSNELTSQYQNTQLQLQSTKEAQKHNNTTIHSFQYQNMAYEQKIKQLIELIKEYSNEVITTNNELSMLKEKYNMLVKESENVREQCLKYENENNELKRENEELGKKNEVLVKTVNYLQTNNSDTINENYALSKEIAELKKEVSSMQVEQNKNCVNNENLVCLINKDFVNLSKDISLGFNSIINKTQSDGSNIIGKFVLLSEDNNNQMQNKLNFKVLIETLNQCRNSLAEYINAIEYDNTKMKNEVNELKLKNEKNEKEIQSNIINVNEKEKLVGFYTEQSNAYKNEVDIIKNKYEEVKNELNTLNEMVNVFFNSLENKLGISLSRQNIPNNFTVIEKYINDNCTNKKGSVINKDIEVEYKALKKKYDACITELELKAIQIANMEKIIDKKNESLKKYYHNVNENKH